MSIEKIFAQLNCKSLKASEPWFSKLFGRAPDAHPMEGLLEWHHAETAGFQLFHNQENAGSGTMTLIVQELAGEHERLNIAGLEPSDIESADSTSLVRLHDPDRNLIVLAQPGRP